MTQPCKIAILGSTGMLGHALGKYFDKNDKYETYLSYRDLRYAYGKRQFYLDALNFNSSVINFLSQFDYVINCIGAIKQHSFALQEYEDLNSTFPTMLAEGLRKQQSSRAKFIHISTDCVFDGTIGNYTENSIPNASNHYGKSKINGEPYYDCMVIRTSFIGHELHTKVSLLEWAKSQAGKTVNGYSNHYWNGVTTDYFAKCCDDIIQNNLYTIGLRHVFNPTPVSKEQMLHEINDKFSLGLTINPVKTSTSVNRTLSTVYDLNDKLNVPAFHDQLIAL